MTLAEAMAEAREEWSMKNPEAGKKLLCKDCKHYTYETNSYGPDYNRRCLHPKFIVPIDGDGTPIEYARLESKKCGPTGKLWEPKPPRAKTSLLGWLRQ